MTSTRTPERTALNSDGISVKDVRYVVITPARNEGENIEATIRSVASQTVRPQEWIIVDDGSTDRTVEIVKRLATEYSWVRLYQLADRGYREPGSGVIRAFNQGLGQLQSQDWEFIVKLDADLELERDYFERCLLEFRTDLTLGVGGGTICHEENGVLKADSGPTFHVRGATKIYRRAFWEAAGGLYAVPGWDTIDEVKANQLGWTTRTFPNINLLHRRFTGSADGAWRNLVKNGRANYITGYHPLFMMLKCMRRIRQEPFLVGSVALFWGFVSGYLKRIPQVADPELIRYVRTQQVRRLLLQSSIWK